jgi:hypothetical protein
MAAVEYLVALEDGRWTIRRNGVRGISIAEKADALGVAGQAARAAAASGQVVAVKVRLEDGTLRTEWVSGSAEGTR